MDVNLFFEQLTTTLHLGKMSENATRVSGGFMHRMYRLTTLNGTYAVKLLNPKIMERPEAMRNFLEADRLESMLQTRNIPIIPSITFQGKKLQKMDGQFFYVFNWFDGTSLTNQDIHKLHCQKVATALSQIHKIDKKSEKYQRSPIKIDWNYYSKIAKEQNPFLFELLSANEELLQESQTSGNLAIHKIPAGRAICHNDLDCKNVLWKNSHFKIIDLECMGYANPYLELFESALCWSGYEECKIDFDLFEAFIAAYFENAVIPTIDWESMYYSNYGRLEWLEYNVKRALFMECNSIEEQELGIEQVKETIAHVIYYHNIKDKLLSIVKTRF